jgi:hypothetical protein
MLQPDFYAFRSSIGREKTRKRHTTKIEQLNEIFDQGDYGHKAASGHIAEEGSTADALGIRGLPRSRRKNNC